MGVENGKLGKNAQIGAYNPRIFLPWPIISWPDLRKHQTICAVVLLHVQPSGASRREALQQGHDHLVGAQEVGFLGEVKRGFAQAALFLRVHTCLQKDLHQLVVPLLGGDVDRVDTLSTVEAPTGAHRVRSSEAVLPQEGLHIDVAFHLLLSRIPGGHVSETAEGHAPVLVAGDTSGDTSLKQSRFFGCYRCADTTTKR